MFGTFYLKIFCISLFYCMKNMIYVISWITVWNSVACFSFFLFLTLATTTPSPPTAPCSPSPCGPHSQCRVVSNTAACSCLQNYIGRPPNCRPECVISAECSSNLACINEKCSDPCPGSCGQYAHCRVINHHPVCTCLPGYTGDALTYCQLLPTCKNKDYYYVHLILTTYIFNSKID